MNAVLNKGVNDIKKYNIVLLCQGYCGSCVILRYTTSADIAYIISIIPNIFVISIELL